MKKAINKIFVLGLMVLFGSSGYYFGSREKRIDLIALKPTQAEATSGEAELNRAAGRTEADIQPPLDDPATGVINSQPASPQPAAPVKAPKPAATKPAPVKAAPALAPAPAAAVEPPAPAPAPEPAPVVEPPQPTTGVS